MRIIGTVSLALVMSTWAASALGQDASAISTARELGQQGLEAYDAGRYDDAVQKLQQAYGVVRVPTFARNAARALIKQGKLVAAAELYREATQLEPNKLWRGDVQQQAQRESAQERQALMPRIARLKIVIEGADENAVIVTIDDNPMPKSLLGTDQYADPGARLVVGKLGEQTVEQRKILKEGERGQVVLRFAAAQTSVTGQVPASSESGPTSEKATPRHQSGTGKVRHTVGGIGVGVGALGLTVGAVTGILALSKRSQLHGSGCVGNDCYYPADRDKMNSYNALLPISSIGFIAGGVVAIAGITLLAWPNSHESKPNVALMVGPGSLAVRGGF